MLLKNNKIYKQFFAELKSKIQSAQIKSALAVNSMLLQFNWELGKTITELQEKHNWGSGFMEQLEKDLQKEFPGVEGFSRSNLYYIKQFYLFYSQQTTLQLLAKQAPKTLYSKGKSSRQSKTAIVPQVVGQLQPIPFVPQLVGQIPWGHHRLILDKIKSQSDAVFYLQKTITHNWSRNVLALQIETQLHKREGKAITNFKNTLPKAQSDLALQTIKDPYIFDFITLHKDAQEKDIENQLVNHITQFLLELGQGFAFMGKQYHLLIGRKDYYIDLLFYHTILRCFVVIEIKAGAFKPEYAGKLNFYLSAIDDMLKGKNDKPTIGILLCKTKESIEVEYALRNVHKPIGISQFNFTENLPKDLQNNLPSVTELEQELNKYVAVKSKPKTNPKNKLQVKKVKAK